MSPYDLNAIFSQMELDLISSMQRTLIKHQVDEATEGFKWQQWQAAKLRNLEKFRASNKDIIGNYNNTIESTIKQTLSNDYNGGQNRVKGDINKLKDSSIELPSNIKNLLKEPIVTGKQIGRAHV